MASPPKLRIDTTPPNALLEFPNILHRSWVRKKVVIVQLLL